ncbi:ATP-binding protein [Ideonella sp. DXS29W]|uniref:histidine kinase n=1 Tax=Ideonella lacteola TaxID=2984193 RepID=A0ABU9BPP8_9BURK
MAQKERARRRPPDATTTGASESWLEVLGFGESSALEDSSTIDPRLAEQSDGRTDDSSFLSRQARRLIHADDSAHQRVYRTYLTARASLGLALALAQLAIDLFSGGGPSLLLGLCGAYALQSMVLRLWTAGDTRSLGIGRRRIRWWMTVGVDLLAFSAMHWVAPTATLNHAALLVLPVLMAGVLSARVPALATAAAASLLLMAAAWHRAMDGGNLTVLLSQAGLAGMGLFVIVLVAGQMAARLAREERTARGSLELARQQAELNRLVIDEMSDGVLVVDRRGRVRAANPAARALLSERGACPPAPFSLASQPGWGRLQEAVAGAYQTNQWPAAGMDLTVAYADESPRSLRVRARFTRGARLGHGAAPTGGQRSDEMLVLFMEELRTVLARQREERLVAMGRISAGIAHEIRNPLAAVSQANALLQEDVLRPDQQRLVRIVADNVERLRRIVDDVMEAAPGGHSPSRTIDVTAEVAAICAEWARTENLALGSDSRLRVLLPKEPLGAIFDPDHLRRVLVNLLENGLRHSSDRPGSVLVILEPLDGPFVRLAVASDGEPIRPEVEPHLFEPFHSTRSRGTGLGLYICRELCGRHGASIDYLRRPDERHSNLFQVVMQRDAVTAEGRLHL